MPNWTKEQELAITKSGTNIIVSAGAGSGKTAVLTERVIRKLKMGIDVDRLLILTFTKASALEMKERIRAAIKKANLKDQLLKLDSSYITTFDSFSLSIVKKYHYLLNVDKDIKLSDTLILKWQQEAIIENIFTKLYEEKDTLFLKLIKDFTVRDDEVLKRKILNMYAKLDLRYDKTPYLDNYFANYFSESFLNEKIFEYEDLLRLKISKIKENLAEIELRADGDFYHDLLTPLTPLLDSVDYDTIKVNLDIKIPRLRKNMDEIKPYKEKIALLLKDLKKLTTYESKSEIYNDILKTKDYLEIIIKILKELDKEFIKYKENNKLYDFIDISKLAIKVVLEFQEVREELKYHFQEILIDEYQDTSDLQELFISSIANNNVYMVGDIKQSIYRFRNANPNLFKEKYGLYQEGQGGFKIDLVKNFRSREETLNNINYIFNYIMNLEIGGADYKNYHQMVFGNTLYNEYKKDSQDNNFEIYNYELTKDNYSKDEVEAFIVANDIKKKVKDHYQVFDKDKQILRDITYGDFVILVDKSKSFELYKKIFEYLGITLTILKDDNLALSYDLFILKNIFMLLKCLETKKIDNDFKYAYLSLGRSYLFNLSDDYLYERLESLNFDDDLIIKHFHNLRIDIDNLPPDLLLEKILDEFAFYEKLITVGNIEEAIIRFDYLESLTKDLGLLGLNYLDILDYLKKLIDNNEEIKYSLNKDNQNSVKIMTIHTSKGLEYHVCYYTGLSDRFNFTDAKERFIFDTEFGFITPLYEEGIKTTILHTLYSKNYIKEDIGERIRLFYVALTRAKEKMILVTTLKETEDFEEDEVNLDTKLKYISFASILNSLSAKLTNYIKNINLDDYNLTKDYNFIKESNIIASIPKSPTKLEVLELSSNDELLKSEKFSKNNKDFLTKDIKNKLDFGTKLHYLLEITDFKKQDIKNIPLDYQKYFKNFFSSSLLKDINEATIYKEYEFIYQDDGIKKHGIIDLMLEYENHIDIIDYKLKNIADDAYQQQLKGYLAYIKTKTSKKINLYLYSILDNIYLEVK